MKRRFAALRCLFLIITIFTSSCLLAEEYPKEELRITLLRMMEIDQEARRQGDPKATLEVDKRHAEFLSELLATDGWPRISEVGRDAAQAAWILAQHADHDQDLQRKVLEVLMEYLKKGEANPPDVALLHDRVAVANDTPQRYGTQGRCVEGDGWVPREVENISDIANLREEMGLPPFGDYVEKMQSFCQ